MTSTTRAYGPWDSRLQRVQRLVFGEAELQAVLTELAARPSTSRTLVLIAESFRATRRITLPASLPGLVLEAVASAQITIAADLASLVSLNADHQEVRGLRALVNDSTKNIDYLATVDSQITGARVIDCKVISEVVVAQSSGIVNAISQLSYGQIRGNMANGLGSKTIVNGLLLGCAIEANTASGAGSIVITSATARNTIVGNSLSGGSITTSGSGGGNHLAGNAFVGSKTLHATDVDADDQNVTGTQRANVLKIVSLRG